MDIEYRSFVAFSYERTMLLFGGADWELKEEDVSSRLQKDFESKGKKIPETIHPKDPVCYLKEILTKLGDEDLDGGFVQQYVSGTKYCVKIEVRRRGKKPQSGLSAA